MTEQVVVLGAGYAGAGAVARLESELDGEADVTWVSDTDYHLLLHESHRCIRDPSVQQHITIPVGEIARSVSFVEGRVVGVDTGDRVVELDGGDSIDYDYLLVAIGSETAFFGIEGLERHALTLNGLDDAIAIHDAVRSAAREATREDPAEVVVGGAGLSGIQTAGEIAAFRDDLNAPIHIQLIEGLDRILPNGDPELGGALRKRLESRDIDITTNAFIGDVDEDTVYADGDSEFDYDVLVWTGGITGRAAAAGVDVRKDDRTDRFDAESTFRTDDERVFAVGDCALIEQPNDELAPPTAQAAWQAAKVAGTNLARAVRGEPLETWRYDDKGTVVSVGEAAVAHDIDYVPVRTFGGAPARFLKKAIAARWIVTVDGFGRALDAWGDL